MTCVNPDRRLVALAVMASQLRVPRNWLKREAEEGRIPCLRAGSRLLFHSPTVEAILTERAQRPQSREVSP